MINRYKHFWYGAVLIFVKEQHRIDRSTKQGKVILEAIEKANEETLSLPYGDLRMKAVRIVYDTKEVNIDGAALQCFVSARTVKRWLNQYIYTVAKHAGF